MWVLLVLTIVAGEPRAMDVLKFGVAMQEFSSKETCEKAITQLQAMTNRRGSLQAACVEK